ncbi:MAG TPA: cell division topological specificity factor MinE [Anaeromyxobacteraceae bacterium]|nr:cell division topological specificity factor MinE [Anaeromyxobacteraceae bacterium]
MNILQFFRTERRPSHAAAAAKERLQIVLAHERASRDAPEFLPQLQHELLAVIKKYVTIDDDKVGVKLQREHTCSILEVNVELPFAAPPRRARAGT